MTDAEKFETVTLINGLYNAHGKTCSSAGTKTWTAALEDLAFVDVERAFEQVAKLGEEFPSPSRVRRIASNIVTSKLAAEAVTYRCHFHGDGRWEPGGVGRPNEPSRNPTADWCDRCRYYVDTKRQAPHEGDRT